MSRTTLSADCPEGLTDHCGNGRVRQILTTPPGPLDQDVNLRVRECPKGLIDAGQARARAEQHRQNSLGKLLLFSLREGQDFLGQGLDSGSIHLNFSD